MSKMKKENVGMVGQTTTEVRIQKDQPWICPGCGALLGFVGKGGREIRIKYKDLYISVEGGRVSRPCRKCGRFCELFDEVYVEYVRERFGEDMDIEEEEIKE